MAVVLKNSACEMTVKSKFATTLISGIDVLINVFSVG